jgi:hypothetical protein
MKLETFKIARELYLKEQLDKESNEVLYEFLSNRYADQGMLNEGIFSSMVSWFKRNFSPRASKIKTLGKEYYDWLMSEYNSTYKGGDSESALDSFLRNEKVSTDIETQIEDAAGEDETYQDLAKKTILKYRVAAKKDFAKKVAGEKSEITKRYATEFTKVNNDVEDTISSLSADDAKNFKDMLKQLSTFIQKDGKSSDVAGLVASGILIFFQNRKMINVEDYDLEKVQKEYRQGEKVWFSVNSSLNNIKGAEYMYAIRSYKGEKELKLKTMTGSALNSQYEQINDLLKDAGVNPDRDWGLVQLFLSNRTDKERENSLTLIKDKLASMDDEAKAALSRDIEKKIDDIEDNNPDDINAKEEQINSLENSLKSEPKKTEKEEEKPEEEKPEEESKEKQEEKKESGESERLIEEVKKKPDTILSAIKGYVIPVAASVEKDGKFILPNGMSKELSDLIKPKFPTNVVDAELVKSMKDTYIEKLDSKNIKRTTLKKGMLKKSAESLFFDYKKCLELWKNPISNASPEDKELLKSSEIFFEMIAAKNGSPEPAKDIKESYASVFSTYVEIP